jgi:hypothetical protein
MESEGYGGNVQHSIVSYFREKGRAWAMYILEGQGEPLEKWSSIHKTKSGRSMPRHMAQFAVLVHNGTVQNGTLHNGTF